jgi:glycosyltransferase involved in cell wall biosynthesis
LISIRQKPDETSNKLIGLAPHQHVQLPIAVIVEDLRLPLDEGAKKNSFSIIRSLVNSGAEVFVFTRHENPGLDNIFPLPGNKFLVGDKFRRNLRAQAPGAIVYIPASSGTIGAFIRAAMIKVQSLGRPLALLSLQYRNLPLIARYFRLQRVVDIVFTQSQASAEVFRSFGCRTILLPGGVDRAVFQPASQQEKRLLRLKYGFQDADQVILHIGHCNRNRNVMMLCRLALLGFRVILIASTSTAIDHELLSELRQSGVTVITDFIENIQHFYQIADCYLFPVFRSSSAIDAPLSVLEAMACNLPVVTTRFGALPGMFEPGKGFYYADTDDEIVQMVKQAVEEKDCRTLEMVSAYSWDNTASTILEAFQESGNP